VREVKQLLIAPLLVEFWEFLFPLFGEALIGCASLIRREVLRGLQGGISGPAN
jgi:hypothetical protein